MRARAFVLAVSLAGLAGCGQYTKPGAGPEDLSRDRIQCRHEDPRLLAEYDKLSADRAYWFDAMQQEVLMRRHGSPAYRHAERQHSIVSDEQSRVSDRLTSAVGRCLERRGWTFKRS